MNKKSTSKVLFFRSEFSVYFLEQWKYENIYYVAVKSIVKSEAAWFEWVLSKYLSKRAASELFDLKKSIAFSSLRLTTLIKLKCRKHTNYTVTVLEALQTILFALLSSHCLQVHQPLTLTFILLEMINYYVHSCT